MSEIYMMGEEIVDAVYEGEKKVYGRNLLPTVYSLYSADGLYGYIKLTDEETDLIASIYDSSETVDMSGIYFGFTGNGKDIVEGIRWIMKKGELVANRENRGMKYFSYFPNNEATLNKIFKRFNIKIEKGTKATGWSPAPEDLIDSLKPKKYPLSIIQEENKC